MRFKRYGIPSIFALALLASCAGEEQTDPKGPSPQQPRALDRAVVPPPTKPAPPAEPAVIDPNRGESPEDAMPEEPEGPGPISTTGELFLATDQGVRVVKLVLGNGVDKTDGKKTPQNPGAMFSAEDTERIIAFMTVENPESLETELAVSFLAPDGETERGKVQVSIPARPKWVTRAFYKIRGPAGNWTLVIRHGDRIIARAPFEFTTSSSPIRND